MLKVSYLFVGLSYIIPVTGFFCKLCHKFYNNEKSAKGAHCQSETHYEKFKVGLWFIFYFKIYAIY